MKKFVLSLILSVSLIGSAFCENIFAHRFFEVKLDVPLAVSNNLVDLQSIFQETIVVDLPKIADSLKLDNGARFVANASPSLSINLDIPRGLILGINVGAEADVSFGLSPDIFVFIGRGNASMGSEFKQQTTNTYVDLFAHAELTGGWNGKKNRIAVTGSTFWPLAHLDAGDTYVALYNNEAENKYEAEANVDAKMYAAADFMHMEDMNKIINQAKSGMGFDIAADVQRDLFRFLTVGAKVRFPIVPGKLNWLSKVEYNMKYWVDFDELLNQNEQQGSSSSSESGSGSNSAFGSSVTPEEGGPSLEFSEMTTKPYEIHRPLKFGVSANFHPFGTLLSTSGYLGMGVRHPFAKDTKETQFYVDYSLAGKLSLWNVINLEVSHACMDQIFKNQIALSLNIRLVEVDAGVSFQSASFAKSFTGAGVGAYVTVCIGF